MRFLTWQESRAGRPFTAVIDVRSPAEHAEDRVPGAVNLPVLEDAERAEVGRLYVQESRFKARRLGAAMVARNAARHLETWFADQPEHASFLLYCWRGGQRSRALAMILDAVGWQASVLAGGYKAWRAWVREDLERRCGELRFSVVTGLTGTGKTALLRHLASRGEQVLDLEGLGEHRGSLLGDQPEREQPSQKRFESLLRDRMEAWDARRPVWVEGESKRLGRLWLPEPLWRAMEAAPVHELEVPAAVRADFLLQEYAHFTAAPEALAAKLETLREACGGVRLAEWREAIRGGRWQEFVASILEHHYDPGYRRKRRFAAPIRSHVLTDLGESGLEAAADELLRAAAAELENPCSTCPA